MSVLLHGFQALNTRQSHAASAPTHLRYGGKNAPVLESYLPQAPYASGSQSAAQRQATLRMQALEARFERTLAGGTVRTLRAGTSLHITQSPLPGLLDNLREETVDLMEST